MNTQQITLITFSQKELQNIMRESCLLNGVNDKAPICITIDMDEVKVSHPPHVITPTPEEPVNNADGH